MFDDEVDEDSRERRASRLCDDGTVRRRLRPLSVDPETRKRKKAPLDVSRT